MTVGSSFTVTVPPRVAAAYFGIGLSDVYSPAADLEVTIKLERISPKRAASVRSLEFVVSAAGTNKKHVVELTDSEGSEVFSGPMANTADPRHVAAPMPGVVEKIHIEAGQLVAEGDVLLTVSAMKMEVHVKAPHAARVAKVHVASGDKTIEGALLVTVDQVAEVKY